MKSYRSYKKHNKNTFRENLYTIYLIIAITQGIAQWKVGITTDIPGRLKNLKVANPNIVGVESSYEINDREVAYKVENMLKRQLREHKVGGEWFTFESLDNEKFQDMCGKCEKNARIWKQIQTDLNNDKNNNYRY